MDEYGYQFLLQNLKGEDAKEVTMGSSWNKPAW
jgi:hypothetical protein